MSFKEKLKDTYSFIWDNYEKFLLVPIILVALSGLLLFSNFLNTGKFVQEGIDFTGGSKIEIPMGSEFKNTEAYKSALEEGIKIENYKKLSSISGEQKWLVFTTKNSEINGDKVREIFERKNLTYGNTTVNRKSSELGDEFRWQAQLAVVAAFLIMSTIIFVAFRSLVPSIAVILAVVTDLFLALGGMALFGIELSLGTLAALLMILGYSVDTDILLATRVLKRKSESLKIRNLKAIKTGLTYSVASIAAFIVLFVASFSPILKDIASVLILGLLADIPSTWFQNSIIMKKSFEKKE